MSVHEDQSEDFEGLQNGDDRQAHQGCYIFHSSKHENNDFNEQPKKKRKISTPDSHDETPIFLRLLAGNESSSATELRSAALHEIWLKQEENIQTVLKACDEEALSSVIGFIRNSTVTSDGRVPTGLVVVGPHGNAHARLLDGWMGNKNAPTSDRIIQLNSNHATNLQSALKDIIKTAIVQIVGMDGYQDFLAEHKRLIPMNFDLELLEIFAAENKLERVVISILDVETLDIGNFSDLISTLSSWSDRIPFVLLLGLVTTVELFEARVPKSTIRLLDAQIFDLTTNRDIHYEIFRATQTDPEIKLYLGPATCGILEEMAKDQATTPEMFAGAIKHAYMSHFFANPLSLCLTGEDLDKEDLRNVCEAIRNSESFQNHAERMLSTGKKGAQSVQKLLKDDNHLLEAARSAIEEGQRKMTKTYTAIDAFKELPTLLMFQPPANSSAFDIDMEALSGRDFVHSDPYISIMGVIEKLQSDQLQDLLELSQLTGNASEKIFDKLAEMLERDHRKRFNIVHYSAYDPSAQKLTTAVTNPHTIPLGPKPANPNIADDFYTGIVDEVLEALETYFDTHITKAHYKNLFMHEAFVYDLKVPLNMAFTPRPRYAIERALERPGDYLGCECCESGGQDNTSHDQMPPTSILWKLWCEAGAIVNVRDLWEAFRGILVDDHDQANGEVNNREEYTADSEAALDNTDDGVQDGVQDGKMTERLALALFYRSLAELKMLGFVKPSKRKPGVDCLAKTSWRGL